MPWQCKANKCHETHGEEFKVVQPEFREDCINHTYEPTDEHLSEPVSQKVYVGDESKYDTPECSICEHSVEWVPGEGDADYCPKTEDHRHVIDHHTVHPADTRGEVLVDFNCRACGRSGSVEIDPEEVNW